MDQHALVVLEFEKLRLLLKKDTSTVLGQRLAESLLPYSDKEHIEAAIEQTTEMRLLLADGHLPSLAGVVDASGLLSRAHDNKIPLEPEECWRIEGTLLQARSLKERIAGKADRVPRLAALTEQFLDHGEILKRLDEIIDAPGEVMDSASAKLAEVRSEILVVDDEVRVRLRRLMDRSKVRASLQQTTSTMRRDRHVLAVKYDMKGHVPGILHDESQSGATVFIEPAEIVPISNRLRDLKLAETREVNRILWELTRFLIDQRHAVLHTCNLLAWLDLTVAKAKQAERFQAVAPASSSRCRVRLRGARHPLLLAQSKSRDEVVPIDVRLNDGFGIMVITGPNTGGKTVTLKTVGLLQLMYQAGLHIPAETGSSLPVFKQVFADIGDEQSLEQSLSTFSGHITNMSQILRSADGNSLVLLDELGAGTDPTEGAALSAAILDELRSRNTTAIVTTHLGSLKNYAFRNPDVENASVEFDPETLAPTFRLLTGQPGNSNALTIAARYGLPASVIDSARATLDEGATPGADIIDDLTRSRRSVEERRQEAEQHLEKSRNINRAAEEKLRHAEKKGQRTQREAESLLDDVLRTLQREARAHLADLQSVPGPLKPRVHALGRLINEAVKHTSVGQRRRDLLDSLKKNDTVYIPRFTQTCRIQKIHRADEELTVAVGNLTMRIPFDDISWLNPGEDS